MRSAPASASGERAVSFPSTDGFLLSGTVFEPEHRNGLSVLVSSGYAIPRTLYGPYARFLAGRGFTVLIWDYRGIGGSSERGWGGAPARVRDWGERDLAAAIEWLHAHAPRHRLLAVGHSAGGALFGLAPNNHRVRALLGIASQSAYWRLRDGWVALDTWLDFFLRVPLAARLGGWFPRLRRGRFAVPRGVALEFAAWGRNPAFIVDERGAPLREHFDRYAGRVRLYRISDDVDFAPRRAVEALAGFFPGAAVEVTPRTPAEWGVPRVGHFGFFDRALARVAWPETAHWLEWAGGAPLPPAVPARKQSGSARPLTAAAQPG